MLSLLYGRILTSIHDYWENHSFDYIDLYLGEVQPTKCPMDLLGLSGLVTWLGWQHRSTVGLTRCGHWDGSLSE